MSKAEPPYVTVPIQTEDARSGFSSGKYPLDDYFARHALANDRNGVSRAYVLRREPDDTAELPLVLGYYTLSMATAESSQVAGVLNARLPKYPMPVALIGRLAVDNIRSTTSCRSRSMRGRVGCSSQSALYEKHSIPSDARACSSAPRADRYRSRVKNGTICSSNAVGHSSGA